MGRDLSLIILLEPRDLHGEPFCTNFLRFERDESIFRQLEGKTPTIRMNPIPAAMWIKFYGEKGIQRTRVDHYREELKFAYANDLRKLEVASGSWNIAIKAFIGALPDDTPIILMWC